MFGRLCFLFVTVQTFQLAHAGDTQKKSQEPKPIVYPGPTVELTNRYGSVAEGAVPDECRNKTFCTIKPPDYPQEMFNRMFKGHKLMMQPELVLDDMIGDRQGDPTETDDCKSEVTYKPLYKVKAAEGDWRTVIQAPEENYIQRIRLEECRDTSSSCFKIFSGEVETHCRQKYSTWEVLVSDGKGGSEKIKTDLPICCSCVYKI